MQGYKTERGNDEFQSLMKDGQNGITSKWQTINRLLRDLFPLWGTIHTTLYSWFHSQLHNSSNCVSYIDSAMTNNLISKSKAVHHRRYSNPYFDYFVMNCFRIRAQFTHHVTEHSIHCLSLLHVHFILNNKMKQKKLWQNLITNKKLKQKWATNKTKRKIKSLNEV